ncbi:zinc finger, CCHC-type containing protein [Tanacetum coccineum]
MASKNLMQMSTDIVKLDRFDGGSFKRWQKKMQFLLGTLKVAYVLTKPYPEESEDETLAASRERLKFENDDFICLGHILNAMSDPLFDVYQNYSRAKELWNALEERYFTEDATSKKFIVSKFNSYRMVDSRPIMDQMYELEHILSMFTQNNMNMDESIQVASIIDKLLSTYRKDDLSLKDLGKHLLIEEQYRLENKTNDDTSKNKKSGGWTLEATQHGAIRPTMFKTYDSSYSMLYMGNHSTAQVKGKGKIDLVFTSGNTLTLNDVLHVLDVCKNLVSGSLLNKCGKFVGKGHHTGGMFKLNIKDVVNSSVNDVNMTEISDANDASAGIVNNNDAINKMPTSSYYFDSSLLCHARLDEVFEKFRIYKSEVELKCDTRIKCLQTDRGGEYYDPRYFQSTGIVHQVTAPYTVGYGRRGLFVAFHIMTDLTARSTCSTVITILTYNPSR